MDAITKLTQFNWLGVFFAVIVAMIAFKFVSELFEWFIKKFGIETKNMRDKKLLQETTRLANNTAKGLEDLRKDYKTDEKDFRNKLDTHIEESKQDRESLHKAVDKLTNVVIDTEIDNMRWEILNFCSAVSNGRKYNREAYSHLFSIYEKYERVLEENNKENGLVEESIKYIRETYQQGLKNGIIK